MKRIIFSLMAAGFCAGAMAVPAKPGLLPYTQPDGTVIQVRMVGDEHGHVVYSEGGMILVDVNDEFQYARFDADGNPVASGIAVRSGNEHLALQLQSARQREAWEQKVAEVREQTLTQYYRTMAAQSRAKAPAREAEDADRLVPYQFGRVASSFPVFGEQKALVLLVQYQDVAFEYSDHDYFHRALNEEGFSDYGAVGCARDWFISNSGGKFVPQFDVFGPVTLPNDRKYYGENSGFGKDQRAYQMVIDACKLLDDEIDFSQYDRDGDGFIDNVFLFYAGGGEHEAGGVNTVWPHSWDVADADRENKYIFDGVQLNHYACTCEYLKVFDRADGFGTFVHEFSHVIGLPDLYPTGMTYAFTPGPWSVLDSGPYNNDGVTPANYSSYEKSALGWLDFQPIQEGLNELPEFLSSGVAYALPTENPNEFFFFENRQQTGSDTYLPGHGMLIWHVHYDKGKFEGNTVNNADAHQNVDLIEADNVKTADTRDGDPFPGSAGITSYTDSTLPRLITWGRKHPEFEIVDIQESEDGLITFRAVPYAGNAVEEIGSAEAADAVYFDLTGRRVANPEKGIFIKKTSEGAEKVIF